MQVQYASWMEKILSLNWSYFILLLTRHCLLLPNQRWSVVRVLPLQQSSPVSKALTAWEGICCVKGLEEAPLTQISRGDLHGMSSGTAVLAAGSGWGKQFAIWAHQVLLGAVLLVRCAFTAQASSLLPKSFKLHKGLHSYVSRCPHPLHNAIILTSRVRDTVNFLKSF